MRRVFSRILACWALLGGLAGCGQSGPLYLPGQPPPIHVPKEQRVPKVKAEQEGQAGQIIQQSQLDQEDTHLVIVQV